MAWRSALTAACWRPPTATAWSGCGSRANFSPVKRGLVLRQSSSANWSVDRMVPDRRIRTWMQYTQVQVTQTRGAKVWGVADTVIKVDAAPRRVARQVLVRAPAAEVFALVA